MLSTYIEEEAFKEVSAYRLLDHISNVVVESLYNPEKYCVFALQLLTHNLLTSYMGIGKR